MPTIADPVATPINITRNTAYSYVVPASDGLVSITGTGTGFTVTTAHLGRAAALTITYTPTVSGASELHDLAITATFSDGLTDEETLSFLVFPAATIIPNITNPASIRVATRQLVQFPVAINPTGTTYTKSAENLPGWLSVNSAGVITGTSPSDGRREIFGLVVTDGTNPYKRYFVLVVGDGGEGSGGDTITGVPHA